MTKSTNATKVIIFGAAGRAGRVLTTAGVHLGHEVTAFIRDENKLRAAVGPEIFNRLRVVQGDALDEAAVASAMAGHHAAVNAAQPTEDPRGFQALCRAIVAQAEKHLLDPRRLWLFGGLPGLDIPHTKTIGSSLPGMRPMLRCHKVNYDLLNTCDLDWSFICPGPMAFSRDGRPTPGLRVATETMPYQVRSWTRYLPKIAHPFIMLRHMNELVVTYEDAAFTVMGNLEANGPYFKKRVSLAVPSSVPEGRAPTDS